MSPSNKSTEQYTIKTRKSGRMDVIDNDALSRMRKAAEGLIRPVLYRLLKAFFHNRPFKGTIDCNTIRSLLVIPYGDAIGDLIAATSIWRAVKQRNPECRIGVITSGRNESLLRADPDVNATYRFAQRRYLGNRLELNRARQDGYDVVLNLHFTNLTDYGLVSNYIGPRAIKITANHHRREMYQLFFNHIGARPRHSTHLSIHSLELLAEVVDFVPPLTLSETWPSLIIPKETESRMQEQIKARLPDGCNKYIILHLQAGTRFREWGTKNALMLAHLLIDRYSNHTIFLTAAPGTHSVSIADLPEDTTGRIQYFKTSTDLLDLAALIKNASLVITPETSITHFASAMNTPAAVLMSNRDRIPAEWLPLANPARIIAPANPGEPVETISIQEVFEAACTLMDGAWKLTQTSIDDLHSQQRMFQHINGTMFLSDFASDLIY